MKIQDDKIEVKSYYYNNIFKNCKGHSILEGKILNEVKGQI